MQFKNMDEMQLKNVIKNANAELQNKQQEQTAAKFTSKIATLRVELEKVQDVLNKKPRYVKLTECLQQSVFDLSEGLKKFQELVIEADREIP